MSSLVVPEADLDETVDKLANGPTKAYAAARTLLKAWSAGGIAAADVMMLDVAIDLFRTEDTTKRHSQFGESDPSRRPAVSADIFGKVAPGLGRPHKR